MKSGKASVLLVIPGGFGDAIGTASSAEITTYTLVRNFSAMGSRDSAALASALAVANDALRNQALVTAAPQMDTQFLKTPVKVRDNVIIGDARAPVGPDVIMGFVTTQTMFVPIVMFIVIIFAAQMVATAVATEKENKTLESLLAMPVSRSGMVAAKMLAAGLLALAAAAWYMVGMSFYMKGMVQGFGGQAATDSIATAGKIAAELGLTLGITDYVLLGLSVFAAILVALAIALIIGSFLASSTRSPGSRCSLRWPPGYSARTGF
ncbi:MAG: ABC transporter permease [Coriobacteriia bacterium]